MSSNSSEPCYTIREHEFEGQHIRHFPDATVDGQYVVKLHAKQYIPKWNPEPQPGDVTLLCAHANGFWKELYEPFWHDLLLELQQRGVRIRAIWMADFSTQGQSGVLNEPNLGPDPSWADHARDLLSMTNHFRSLMPRPIVGIGHSMGGSQLVSLSLMHLRLLEGIALIEPYIIPAGARAMSAQAYEKSAKFKLQSPDLWDSTEAAMGDLRRSPLFRGWDPRTERLLFASILRQTPTALYPDITGKWTLRTTKHSDLLSGTRDNFEGHGQTGAVATPQGRQTHADVDPEDPVVAPFYNSFGIKTFKQLSHLRPRVLFVRGRSSLIGSNEIFQRLQQETGTGIEGGGGASLGQVEAIEMAGGHLLPFTHPSQLSNELAPWMAGRTAEIREADQGIQHRCQIRSSAERYAISEKRVDLLKKGNSNAWENRPVSKI